MNEKLSQLALSDEGFVFDPHTGDSYQVSEIGNFTLRALKAGKPAAEIAEMLAAEYDVSPEEARRDCADFLGQLRNFGLA